MTSLSFPASLPMPLGGLGAGWGPLLHSDQLWLGLWGSREAVCN